MPIFTRIMAMIRARQLQRQFKQVERIITTMPVKSRMRLGVMTLREIGQASKSEFPHFYGTEPTERYHPWGQGTDLGFSRAQSDNPEIALRGISLWLAVAYHETKDSPHPIVQPQHRQVLRMLRELRDASGSQTDAVEQWMQTGAAA